MNRRMLLRLAPAGLLGAGLAGAAAWMAIQGDPAPFEIGGPFRLTAGDGRTVTDADFRGRWMLVYFGYTHCPDACPTALQDMANAVDALGPDAARRVALLFITIDPERDTPALIQDYVSAFNAPITALSGTPEQIAAAARAYRVYYAKHPRDDGGYDMDHSSIIYLMDPAGKLVGNFTHETPPDAITAKLKGVLAV